MNILKTIEDDWSEEAKTEDTKRFFYHSDVIEKIEQNNKYFIIGRKGSGKTAIAKHLEKNLNYDTFPVKLNFKSFPFNILYELYDKGYKVPNQYITIWKYVIYSHIAKLMLKNENIDCKIREDLEITYGKDPKRLASMIQVWTSADFKIAGTGGAIKREYHKNDIEWIDKVEILEEIIENFIDQSNYYIIFDELDEDYRDIIGENKNDSYLSLLTSLFKAVQDIKTRFEEFQNIKPIVFLRDDIFEIMTDNDKNKWRRHTIKIEWDIEKLKKLFAFRISRTIDAECSNILSFQESEKKIFSNGQVSYGSAKNRKQLSYIDFMIINTHLRPRDLIQYVKLCAEYAIEKNMDKISPSIVKQQEGSFSNYLKSELEDEIFAIFPNITKIFNIFAAFHRQTFKLIDIKKFYESSSTYNELNINEQNIEFVLKIMFHFSVIGNHPNPDQRNFKYDDKSATIEFGKSLCFHRGLFKALKIN